MSCSKRGKSWCFVLLKEGDTLVHCGLQPAWVLLLLFHNLTLNLLSWRVTDTLMYAAAVSFCHVLSLFLSLSLSLSLFLFPGLVLCHS